MLAQMLSRSQELSLFLPIKSVQSSATIFLMDEVLVAFS